MRFVSNRAIVMRPLLAALASLSLFSQLCVSGCAVGPSYRKRATTLENFHSVGALDRKSTRLNSSHSQISYAVFCLKKKNKKNKTTHSSRALVYFIPYHTFRHRRCS